MGGSNKEQRKEKRNEKDPGEGEQNIVPEDCDLVN